jgi:guanylate kinase
MTHLEYSTTISGFSQSCVTFLTSSVSAKEIGEMNQRGVFVVSAPSGTGKTTLNRMLTKKYPNVEIAVSLTTRLIREGEREGFDYHYVSREEFMSHVNRGEMLEWAEVHDNFYGSSLVEISAIQSRDHTPLLEIDVQGWEQARSKLRKATSVFILPPTIEAIWQRLEIRGTDSESTRWRRLKNARKEIELAKNYEHFIINDDVDHAFTQLEAILIRETGGEISRQQGLDLCQRLLRQFHGSELIARLKSMYGE